MNKDVDCIKKYLERTKTLTKDENIIDLIDRIIDKNMCGVFIDYISDGNGLRYFFQQCKDNESNVFLVLLYIFRTKYDIINDKIGE